MKPREIPSRDDRLLSDTYPSIYRLPTLVVVDELGLLFF
jgi:hypothetical protein